MLAVAKQVSDDVLIWEFPNHHLPPYFLRFGSIVTDKVEDLQNFLQGDKCKYNLQDERVKKLTSEQLSMYASPMTVVADVVSE